MAYVGNVKLAFVSLCFLKAFQVANSAKVHLNNHPLVIFHAMRFHLGYRSAGLLTVASLMSVCLVFFPIVRRGWKRRASNNGQGQIQDSPSPVEKDLVDLHDVVVQNAHLTHLEGSESFEEVKLSFGTDRPEVYLKMCTRLPAKKTMPFLRELLVQ